jgi:hypothetical protein
VVYADDQKLIDQGIVSQVTINADKATLDQNKAQVGLDIANIAQQRALRMARKSISVIQKSTRPSTVW